MNIDADFVDSNSRPAVCQSVAQIAMVFPSPSLLALSQRNIRTKCSKLESIFHILFA